MNAMNAAETVRNLAVTIPGATRVFEQWGIDYCCGGAQTLQEACEKLALPVEEIVRSLDLSAAPAESAGNWQTRPLADLASHIVETHHSFTRNELERLERLFAKVCARHGEAHPELHAVEALFHQLRLDLLPHMLKEEQVLFPYVIRLEEAFRQGRPVEPAFFGTVRNPVRMMSMEHDAAGDLLRQMRRETGGYAPPPDACTSFQTLYQALADVEADLHEHIHLENNIFFPRAIALEQEAAPEAQRAGERKCPGQ